MARISIDNGHSYCDPTEAIDALGMDVVVNYMDDDIRERVHREIAPCTDVEFLEKYLEFSPDDLIIG